MSAEVVSWLMVSKTATQKSKNTSDFHDSFLQRVSTADFVLLPVTWTNVWVVGMGKTIMVSSLIQTNRGEKEEELIPDEPERAAQTSKPKQLKLDSNFKPTTARNAQRTRATLIVAPASLMDQWASELEKSSAAGTVNVIVWHGTGREDLASMIDCDVDAIDVVITSYGTLASEHSLFEKSSKHSSGIFDSAYLVRRDHPCVLTFSSRMVSSGPR